MASTGSKRFTPAFLAWLTLVLGAACGDSGSSSSGPVVPTLGPLAQVVPSAGLPPQVHDQTSNNNLDIVDHDGRLFLAFRTAPSHFASPDTTLYVLSTTDEVTWSHEATIQMGSDLREPRFLSWNGELFLYFAQLGENPLTFVPGGMYVTKRVAAGEWTEPVRTFEDTFIPWRTKIHDGVPLLVGYTGGDNIYNFSGDPIQVWLLTTDDGLTWRPFDPAKPVVLEGGTSETTIEFDRAGNLYAVVRNEEGDSDGFGSKICRAPKEDITSWTCATDPKKYDSPLLFRAGDELYLIGRRNVTDTGNYDLGRDDLPLEILKWGVYELDYWFHPKRCSVWSVDGEALTVSFLVDLPSKGDTCFPSVVPRGARTFRLYDYSSPVDGPDVFWLSGQLAPTYIYAQTLEF